MKNVVTAIGNWFRKAFILDEADPSYQSPEPLLTESNLKPFDFFKGDVGNGKVVLPHPYKRGAVVIHGGPYRGKPAELVGIRLELSAPDDGSMVLDFPIVDFGVPTFEGLCEAVDEAFEILMAERELYIGCTGGFGRTGLFMACLVHKVMAASGVPFPNYKGSILYLRDNYTPTAVETPQQKAMVDNYFKTVIQTQ